MLLSRLALRRHGPAYRFTGAGAIIAADVSVSRAPDGDHRAARPARRRPGAGAGARRTPRRAGGRREPALVVRRSRRAPAGHGPRDHRPRARRMSALSAVAVWLQPVLLAGLGVGVGARDPAPARP